MTVGFTSLLLLLFFVTAIAIGFVKKTNTGILGVFFAIIMAMLYNLKFNDVLAGFPTKVVMTLFAVGLFFGYFVENGTINKLAQVILYKFRNTPKALPFVFFFVAMLLGAIGGANMVVFSCALALPIGFASGIKAWETGTICLLGTQAGSYFPFSQHGSTARTIIEGMNDGVWAEQAMAINWKIAFIAVVVYIIIIGAFYFVFKNYQLSKVEGVYKPEPFTSVQKKSLVMIALALSLMIIPPAILKFVSIPALKTIVGYCDVTPICLLGAVINLLLGLGNESKVLKKRVPWNVLAMIFGMAMLVNLASKLGVLDYLSAIAQNIPVAAVAPVFLLAAGFISLFSSTLSVVYPTLLPIAGIVAMNTGINPLLAFSVIVIGSATTAISPLSVGGGQVLSCCTEEICDGQTMFTKQFIMALVSMAILTALSIVGSILMV